MEPPPAPWDDPQNPTCSGPDKACTRCQGHLLRRQPGHPAPARRHLALDQDGTPHQWITPAGENTAYPQGTSVRPVPDMGDSGNATDGEMTFYYTNQQSARLMFYHDHAWGITRLNVYAGEAAPYIIQDATEQALVGQRTHPWTRRHHPAGRPGQDLRTERCATRPAGRDLGHRPLGRRGQPVGAACLLPGPEPGRLPRASTSSAAGPTAPGSGRLPTPSITGRSTTPTTTRHVIPTSTWCEPPLMPGTPYNSMGMESFNDTPVDQRHSLPDPDG